MGKCVSFFIFGIAGMCLDPLPIDHGRIYLIQCSPEIIILDLLEIFLYPTGHPLSYTVDHILGIRMNNDLFVRFVFLPPPYGFDDSLDFHAVVCCLLDPVGKFMYLLSILDEHTPPTWTRVAQT